MDGGTAKRTLDETIKQETKELKISNDENLI